MTPLLTALVLGPAPTWELGTGAVFGPSSWREPVGLTFHARRGLGPAQLGLRVRPFQRDAEAEVAVCHTATWSLCVSSGLGGSLTWPYVVLPPDWTEGNDDGQGGGRIAHIGVRGARAFRPSVLGWAELDAYAARPQGWGPPTWRYESLVVSLGLSWTHRRTRTKTHPISGTQTKPNPSPSSIHNTPPS